MPALTQALPFAYESLADSDFVPLDSASPNTIMTNMAKINTEKVSKAQLLCQPLAFSSFTLPTGVDYPHISLHLLQSPSQAP